jgi:hypothetical protein
MQSIEVKVGSTIVATLPATASGTYSTDYTFTGSGSQTITATATDTAYYTGVGTKNYTYSDGDSGNN